MNTLTLACPDCYAHWLLPFQSATPATRQRLLGGLVSQMALVEQAERAA